VYVTDVVVPPLMMGTTVITGPADDPVVVGLCVDPVLGPDGTAVVPGVVPGVESGVEPGVEDELPVEPPVEPPGVPGVEMGVETECEELPECLKLEDEPRVMVLNVLGGLKVSSRIISASQSDRPSA
jgi:hypothetical protein